MPHDVPANQSSALSGRLVEAELENSSHSKMLVLTKVYLKPTELFYTAFKWKQSKINWLVEIKYIIIYFYCTERLEGHVDFITVN